MKVECSICGAECESVVHVLCECPAYSSCREGFRAKFKELIGDSFERIDKTAYVLSSELWEENFEDTLRLVKEFIVDVWEVRKQKLYGDTCPSHHQCQTLAGDAGPVTGGGGLRVSKMGKLQDKGKLGKLCKFHVQVCSGNVHASDCGSAHCNGCVVNGISARTACIYDMYNIYNIPLTKFWRRST